MSNKKENIFIQSMRISLIIVLIMVIFFLIIQYLSITNDPDSISKFSALFTAISSLSIVATMCVYLWQKKERENEINIKIKLCKEALLDEKEKIKKLYSDAIAIANILNSYDKGCVYVRLRAMSFTFIFEKEEEPKSIIIYESYRMTLLSISNQLIDLDTKLYRKSKVWIKRYDIFVRNLEALFLEKNTSSPRKDKLINHKRFGERLIERLEEINNKINK
ncbi:hypothetical protein GKR71_18015 [Providencia sp. wls1922]|uniref:hypothetical protein n=1 Tax=Providencia sp. wls1922 TaxID=2675152 RepID=UPI0012B66A13|nr:hypothetical protein [Providencia sp. wls1922]